MRLPEIEQLLARNIGLDSNSIGTSAVDRAVRERMRISRIPSLESYWDYLQDSSVELQELIETVVVPETWFFRDEETFTSLVRMTMELRERTSAALRFLSIPCSTGEEPYSIAMALRDAGVAQSQFHVDAVDISGRALAQARRGIYGRNSFRSQNLAFRERYFRLVSEGYALVESISSAVSFYRGNVVTGQLPLFNGPYDAIYCRNLLIYLDRPAQAQVLQTLGSLLAPDGMLFVGPSEAFVTSANGFSSVHGPASFAFRKGQPTRRQPEHVTPPIRRPVRKTPTLQPHLDHPNRQLIIPPTKTTALGLAAVERLADQGLLAEAVSSCEQHISLVGPSADAYYLLGVLRDAFGRPNEAVDCYRRAVYLDPKHVEALTRFALHFEAQGQTAAAQRLQSRAGRLAAGPEVGIAILP